MAVSCTQGQCCGAGSYFSHIHSRKRQKEGREQKRSSERSRQGASHLTVARPVGGGDTSLFRFTGRCSKVIVR